MAWIEYHTQLRDHWKIKRLATIMGVNYNEALGAISCLWLWCVEYAPDGDVTRFSCDELRDAARTNNEKFAADTLKSCELIDDQNKINDWRDHGLKYLKSARLRTKRYRERLRHRNVTVTSTLPDHTIPNHTIPKEEEKIAHPPSPILKHKDEKPGNQILTDVQKVVTVYKLVSGYPKEDKDWDKLNFARCSKTAKQLIEFFGNWKDAADCVQDVYERLTSKGLTVTIETVVKHAADWKKDNQEKGVKHGIFPMPGNGSLQVISGAISTITKPREA